MPQRWKDWLKYSWPMFIGIIFTIIVLFVIPVPYIVYEPGPVEETRDMVKTGGSFVEEGDFLITTVKWTYANVLKYAVALYDPNAEIFEKETIMQGDDRTEYTSRQSLYMRTSHSNAIEAAYQALGIPYEIRSEEILVFGVVEGLSADGVLLPGDRLLSIHETEIRDAEDVPRSIQGLKAGDMILVTFLRGKEERTVVLTLKPLPDTDPPRPGMGITYATLQSVESVDPAYQVQIQAGNIGGPSAGLMFALEIYNQFTEEDWTKGYTIAGTGEIRPDGTVLPIGGVVHKVAGAHSKGAELFFVPHANAEAAVGKAQLIGTDMVIVPVGSLQDALDYLEALPPKGM